MVSYLTLSSSKSVLQISVQDSFKNAYFWLLLHASLNLQLNDCDDDQSALSFLCGRRGQRQAGGCIKEDNDFKY